MSDHLKATFDLGKALRNSVFYPASGLDDRDIVHLPDFNSFVHVDYSTAKDVVEHFLRVHMIEKGYRLVGICEIPSPMMTPNGFRPGPFTPNHYERSRLRNGNIRDRFTCRIFTPFALWAMYERGGVTESGDSVSPSRISLLHIGGEAVATFEALYVGAGLNPGAICIVDPSENEGGDNWTRFTDPDYRLHRLIQRNITENGATYPGILLTDMMGKSENPCFWPEYGNGESVGETGLFKFRIL